MAPSPAAGSAAGAARSAEAYNGADVTVSITGSDGAGEKSGAFNLTAPAEQTQALLSGCTRSKGYEVLFITLSTEVQQAGAAAVATQIGPNYGIQAVLQVGGTGTLPFNTAKQTALLVALSNLLPSSLQALNVRSVVVDSAKGTATATLLVQTSDDPETFAADLAAAAGDDMEDQMAAAGLGEGIRCNVLSVIPAPAISIAGQVAAFGVALPPAAAAALAAGQSGGVSATAPTVPGADTASSGHGLHAGAIVGITIGVVTAVALALAALAAAVVLLRRRRRGPPITAAGKLSSQSSWDSGVGGPMDRTPLGSIAASSAGVPGGNPSSGVGRFASVSRTSAASDKPSSDYAGSFKSWSGTYDVEAMRNMTRMGRMDDSLLGWAIDPADIELARRTDGSHWVLGAGSYGRVYKGFRGGVQDIAVKVMFATDGADGLRQFRDECCILKSLNYDRNVVQFYGAVFMRDVPPMLVLEYCEGGDLRAALNTDDCGELAWYGKGRSIAMDIARGLHFLHSHDVMHSDLKTKNILLTRHSETAKIGDVGLAQFMGSAYFKNENVAWTFAYAAPELLLNATCSSKVDIYSMGVVLWELVTGEIPTRGRLTPVNAPVECPQAVAELIETCMNADPAQRPTAKECFDRLRDASDPPPPASDSIRRASRAAAQMRRTASAIEEPALGIATAAEAACAAATARLCGRSSDGGAYELANMHGAPLSDVTEHSACDATSQMDGSTQKDSCSSVGGSPSQLDKPLSQEPHEHLGGGAWEAAAGGSCGMVEHDTSAAATLRGLRDRYAALPRADGYDSASEIGGSSSALDGRSGGAVSEFDSSSSGRRGGRIASCSTISSAEEAEEVVARFSSTSAEPGEVWALPPAAASVGKARGDSAFAAEEQVALLDTAGGGSPAVPTPGLQAPVASLVQQPLAVALTQDAETAG